MMKRIILLSDGTGNSSAKLFKTNVWRIYQSLDLASDQADVPQIACYNDGVGTSAFRPLALLGGVFGYGLKRNVLHLYEFLCRNWRPNDEIYLFGFSRGAFTVRILAGLIAHQGLLLDQDNATLAYATRDSYRQYRLARYTVISNPILTWVVRPLRDGLIDLVRRVRGQLLYQQQYRTAVPAIAFIGVWDTVTAYGSPIAELTRGIDRFVFPLSMPDRCLNPKVQAARHALSLDDERDTFHPLLWDEINSAKPHRIKQVWFPGMHADVGGGYPDDALSFQALRWMMREAADANLRFLPEAEERFAPPPSRSAPMHDSRKGMAGYYRYQPRKLSAYLLPDDPETEVMRDPSPKAQAHLTCVQVHHSVLDRIAAGTDRYAPIVLPANYMVIQPDRSPGDNPENEAVRGARVAGQAEVWDDVWRKRINYFAMVIVSIVMTLLPLWAGGQETAACEAWYCVAAPVIQGLGLFVPGILRYWTDAYAAHPGLTILFIVVFGLLLARSETLQRQINDRMWTLWNPLHQSRPVRGNRLVRKVRTSPTYLLVMRRIKWTVLPTALGSLALGIIILGGIALLAVPVARQIIANAEADGSICTITDPAPAASAEMFRTSMPCWDIHQSVTEGHSYRVALKIQEPWLDRTILTGADGYDAARLPRLLGYLALPVRRSVNGRWFQPFVTIVSDRKRLVQPLEFHLEGDLYVALLVPAVSGDVLLWVNDAVMDLGFSKTYYGNNLGSALVQIVELR